MTGKRSIIVKRTSKIRIGEGRPLGILEYLGGRFTYRDAAGWAGEIAAGRIIVDGVAADAVFGAEKRRKIERLRENIRRVVQIFVHTGWIRDESDAFSLEEVCVSFQIVDAVHVVDPVIY